MNWGDIIAMVDIGDSAPSKDAKPNAVLIRVTLNNGRSFEGAMPPTVAMHLSEALTKRAAACGAAMVMQ